MNIFLYLTSLIFALGFFWLFTDPRTVRERISYYFTSKKTYLFTSYLFVLAIQYGFLVRSILVFHNTRVSMVGVVLFIIGALFALWAKITMREIWGPPAQLTTKRQNRLVTTGPFIYSRNPIYAGLLLMMLGYFLAIQSWLFIFVGCMFLYLHYKTIPVEETLLRKHFGKEYETYMAKTRRWF